RALGGRGQGDLQFLETDVGDLLVALRDGDLTAQRVELEVAEQWLRHRGLQLRRYRRVEVRQREVRVRPERAPAEGVVAPAPWQLLCDPDVPLPEVRTHGARAEEHAAGRCLLHVARDAALQRRKERGPGLRSPLCADARVVLSGREVRIVC